MFHIRKRVRLYYSEQIQKRKGQASPQKSSQLPLSMMAEFDSCTPNRMSMLCMYTGRYKIKPRTAGESQNLIDLSQSHAIDAENFVPKSVQSFLVELFCMQTDRQTVVSVA